MCWGGGGHAIPHKKKKKNYSYLHSTEPQKWRVVVPLFLLFSFSERLEWKESQGIVFLQVLYQPLPRFRSLSPVQLKSAWVVLQGVKIPGSHAWPMQAAYVVVLGHEGGPWLTRGIFEAHLWFKQSSFLPNDQKAEASPTTPLSKTRLPVSTMS